MSARKSTVRDEGNIPVNGRCSRPSLDCCFLLATRAHISFVIPRVVGFLDQHYPHYDLRIWLSSLLECNFVVDLDYFCTCVQAEVIHPLIHEFDESTVLCGLFVNKKKSNSCLKLLCDVVNIHIGELRTRISLLLVNLRS